MIHGRECIDTFKARFHYWDEWSSARYVRRVNPYIDPEVWARDFPGKPKPPVEWGSIVRYIPVKGTWVPLEHEELAVI